MTETPVPSFSDVLAARDRIGALTRLTPLVESEALNRRFGGRLLVKLEPLQVGASFKFRGALNAIISMSTEQRKAGVVAFSSGNHAIAVSAATALLRIPAVIIMPSDVPKTKLAQTKANGAEVILYDRDCEDRVAIGADIVRMRHSKLIPPFDDPMVIAGQGTIALEIVEQANAMNARLDGLLVACSGGGLSAGCALALAGTSPATKLTIVEPEGFDDTGRSLAIGKRVTNDRLSGSICDALLVSSPGVLTFPILRDAGVTGVMVSDDAVLEAMHIAWDVLKVAVEPGGAAALAAVTSEQFLLDGRTIAVVCSGGNLDETMAIRALSRQV